MLDRALTKTFRNLSTLILVACVITLPVHLTHAFLYRNALSVAELAPEINEMPEGRQVRGVSKGDFAAERNAALIVLGIELLLLPLFYRAARRVIVIDEENDVPTVLDAWTDLTETPRSRFELGPVLVAGAIGVAAGALVWLIGGTLADMASSDMVWVIEGAARGVALAVAIALGVGAAAALPAKEPVVSPVEKLDLY